ncbi:MAG: LysR family transcriptional regulator [Methylococcales bacterium]|nr:LysR family transcriptional regulator [Methylococcales bacterium]
MDKFNNMQVFCRIVELGTFAAVARERNLSAMMISKYMAHLEKSLGVVLLNRTTRSLTLTEAGEVYYNRCKQLLEDLDDLEASTSQLVNTVKGSLSINAPIDFGGLYMVPAIEAYQRLYPEVKILMSLDNKPVNLRKGNFDISLVVTDTLDQGIVARKIARTELSTYASPAYLTENGTPQTPSELSSHRCLHYVDTPHGDSWIFNNKGTTEKVKNDWVFASNNGRALCEAAALGMGIVQAPKLSVRHYLENKQLIEILHEYRTPSLFVYATYLQRRFYPAKLTTFIDFLASFFEKKIS